MKNFLIRLYQVLKYIPNGTWKLLLTMHFVCLIPVAGGFLKNGYTAAQAFFWSFFWFTILIYPIVFYVYWRMHHGQGNE